MMESVEKFTASLREKSCFDPAFSSLTAYRFSPHPYPLSRLEHSLITPDDIDGKKIFLIDDFFTEEESHALRTFSEEASFSRKIYGSEEAMLSDEDPALTMNHFESVAFFTVPPAPILSVYRLLSGLGHTMDATISTLPWELSDGKGTGSPTFATNFLRSMTKKSRELGIHADSEPEKGLGYTIPKLYAPGINFPHKFVNGSRGNPLIVTLMLYATAENFLPQYAMGTLFCDNNEEPICCCPAEHMRIALFESDILHTIQESNIPEGTDTWRVSYVFKLLINPHSEGQCLRSLLTQALSYE